MGRRFRVEESFIIPTAAEGELLCVETQEGQNVLVDANVADEILCERITGLPFIKEGCCLHRIELTNGVVLGVFMDGDDFAIRFFVEETILILDDQRPSNHFQVLDHLKCLLGLLFPPKPLLRLLH